MNGHPIMRSYWLASVALFVVSCAVKVPDAATTAAAFACSADTDCAANFRCSFTGTNGGGQCVPRSAPSCTTSSQCSQPTFYCRAGACINPCEGLSCQNGTSCEVTSQGTGICQGVSTSGTRCGNGVIEAPEVCDGSNLGPTDCRGLGFSGGLLSCATDCRSFDQKGCAAPSTCGNQRLDTGEQCDGNNVGSQTCASMALGSGTVTCNTNCSLNLSGCSTTQTTNLCGNGTQNTGETCDGSNYFGDSCQNHGYGGGFLTCSNCALSFSNCTGTQTTAVCRDGKKDMNELCDGNDFGPNGNACMNLGLGYTAGYLSCTSTCQLDKSQCEKCGDSQVTGSEDCEGTGSSNQTCASVMGGSSGGTLRCSACRWDTTQCYVCGDGVKSAGEACDYNAPPGSAPDCTDTGVGFKGGGPTTCTTSCQLDTSSCTNWAEFPADGSGVAINVSGAGAQRPSLTLDSTTTPLVAWLEQVSGVQVARVAIWRPSSNVWGPYVGSGTQISTPGLDAGPPTVAWGDDGSPRVAWSERGDIHQLKEYGSTWVHEDYGTDSTVQSTPTNSSEQSMAVVGSTVYVVWEEDDDASVVTTPVRRVMARSAAFGGSFYGLGNLGDYAGDGVSQGTTQRSISDAPVYSSVAADFSNVWVAWTGDYYGSPTIFARVLSAGSWQGVGASPNPISDQGQGVSTLPNPQPATIPVLKMAAGNPWIAYLQATGNGTAQVVVRRWDGSTQRWLAPSSGTPGSSLVGSIDAADVSMVIDSQGNPIVAWEEHSDGVSSMRSQIKLVHWTGTAWAPYESGDNATKGVSQSQSNAVNPSLAYGLKTDGTHLVCLAWSNEVYVSGPGQIIVRCHDVP